MLSCRMDEDRLWYMCVCSGLYCVSVPGREGAFCYSTIMAYVRNIIGRGNGKGRDKDTVKVIYPLQSG